MKKVTLVIFNEKTPIDWSCGEKISINFTTNDLLANREKILETNCDYILFWDAINALPKSSDLENVIKTKGNLWHIGSLIGLKDKPELLDYIQPTSMLHVRIDSKIDHSSWKNSFRGCLLEKKVFKLVLLANYSNSLDIISLDFGYKALKSGVFTRYSTELTKTLNEIDNLQINLKEELQFIQQNFDTKALYWTYLNNFFKVSPFTFYKINKERKHSFLKTFDQNLKKNILKDKDLSVSVVIATLERYSFLIAELIELRKLEIPLKEIIIIDQTPEEKRSIEFLKGFDDLPIVYLESEVIGQCTARNLGIKHATSKFIWFLDDDMEDIPVNYLRKHLETIYSFKADISCGIPDEIGTKYIDRSESKIEVSDGFPTNDVLVKRNLIDEVGGFDVKMDQKQSEDQEIGLRCVKKGALSVKNNQLRIIHLRAPRGGLRNHNVRKITFSSSRNNLFQRRYFHESEIYLNLKHFSKTKTVKSILLNLRGTFVIRGSFFKKVLKIIVSTLFLPYSILILYKKYSKAKQY